MNDSSGPDATLALNDAAAHARVLAAQLAAQLAAIGRDYPTIRLGGALERLAGLSRYCAEHAQALTDIADLAIASRPEAGAASCTYSAAVPDEVLAIFEAAQVIRHPVSVQEAAQAGAGGRLVVLRDPGAQSAKLVRHHGAIFQPDIDPLLVRLWWPRVFCEYTPVALVETTTEGVWQEVADATPWQASAAQPEEMAR